MTSEKAPRRRRRPTLDAVPRAAAALVAAGALVAIYAGERWEGFAVLILCALAFRASELAGERRRLRERLRGRMIVELARPFVEVGSNNPRVDARRIRTVGAGLVRDPNGIRVVLPRDLNDVTLPAVLAGCWNDVGRRAATVDGSQEAARLRRLPGKAGAWIVTAGGAAVGVLTAECLQQAAREPVTKPETDAVPPIDHPSRVLSKERI